MTDGQGRPLAEQLRGHPEAAALPLLFLSPVGHQPDGGDGPTAVSVTKPVKQTRLHDALTTLLRAPDQPGGARTDEPVDAPLAETHPLRILLVEDNRVNRKVAVRVLGTLGYTAEVATHGADALHALRESAFDLVLMDVQMPEMDGLEATRRIRAEWPADEQPHIIAMTAAAMDEDRERCRQAGMDGFVSKPIQLDELVEMLKQAARATASLGGDGAARG
jgi:CheY-like chemotaxis protein